MTDSGQGSSGLSRGELREAALAGVRWTTLARVGAELLSLVASIVLARLISPAEFGRAAIALTVIAVAGVLSSQGVGAALVQMRDAERVDVQSATALAMASGVLFALMAWLIGRFAVPPVLGDRVGYLVALGAPAFLLAAPGTVPQALLQRELRFQRLGAVHVAALIGGAVASVVLAATIAPNAEALVAGGLVVTALATILSITATPMVAPRWNRGAGGRIASFGVNSGLASLFYTLFRRVDYAILAGRLNAADTGFYWRAYQLGVEYQAKVTTVMLRVSFPVFSRTKDMEDMRRVRARVVRLHASVVIPPLAAFVALAPELVPLLYGSDWKPSVGPAQILAVVGMGTAIVTGIGPLLMAAGRPRALMLYNLVTLAVYALAVYLLAPHGLTTVCVGVLAVQAVNFAATHWILLDRMLGIPIRSLWGEIAPGTCAGLALLAVTYPLVDALATAGVGPALVVLITAPVAALIAVVVLWRGFPAAWDDALLIVRTVRPGRRAEA